MPLPFKLGLVLLLALAALALWPEPPARLLTDAAGWQSNGWPENRAALAEIPASHRQLRRSVAEAPGSLLFRSWTPHGIVPLEVTSAPFHPDRYLSVIVTGTSRSADGRTHAWIECESNGQQAAIFNGSVNSHVAEAVLALPDGWCPGDARLRLLSPAQAENVGIGSAYAISWLSYVKSSFIGRLPYLLAAWAVFGLVLWAGAALAQRHGIGDPLPFAFIALGVAALLAFYFTGLFKAPWGGAALAVCAVASALASAGRDARAESARKLEAHARLWGFASLAYFSLSALAVNGLGHWEPNYRFWPAMWSSDNELPWMFAEALRQRWNLSLLFGDWMPTDRPPLMAGAHLLVAEGFRWLQANNDGVYLRGQAYNASAIALNALWAPACAWLLPLLRPGMAREGRLMVLALLACLPLVLFNTVYGWPKVFGAAFSLLAAGVAWQIHKASTSRPLLCVAFFVLGTLSVLAHASAALFLAPLGLLFLYFPARRNVFGLLVGLAVAMPLMLSWSLYKAKVLPSHEPVTKYALTGDFGFAKPTRPLSAMLAERYAGLDFTQWLDIKKTMLAQSFAPADHAIAQIRLNSDFGQGAVDRLRAWDFMLLSKGNLPAPLLTVLAAWHLFRQHRRGGLASLREDTPAALLVGLSVLAWLLMVLGFFAPVIVHHWPQAALFGLALGGAVIVQRHSPKLFGAIVSLSLAYCGAVWVLSPLHAALDIDIGAGVALLLLGGSAIAALRPPSQRPGETCECDRTAS